MKQGRLGTVCGNKAVWDSCYRVGPGKGEKMGSLWVQGLSDTREGGSIHKHGVSTPHKEKSPHTYRSR